MQRGRVDGESANKSVRARPPEKGKGQSISQTGLYLCRQRPTLPHTFACSTIGPAGLNFRVRDGNGWIPRGEITDKSKLSAISRQLSAVLRRANVLLLMDSELA